jgi:hypothetical protein
MTTEAITPLRRRMSEDMNARKLGKHTQRGHIYSCKRFAGFKGSSNDVALNRDVIRFDADPTAVAALRADGQPSGVLPVPVVSIHSINDPHLVVEVQSTYRNAANDTLMGRPVCWPRPIDAEAGVRVATCSQ